MGRSGGKYKHKADSLTRRDFFSPSTWTHGYCAFFAKKFIEAHPGFSYAIEYHVPDDSKDGVGVPEHIYAFNGDVYVDASGVCESVPDDELTYTITGMTEEDVRKTGLFSPGYGLRHESETVILAKARNFIDSDNFQEKLLLIRKSL